jgi:hypothetical protein
MRLVDAKPFGAVKFRKLLTPAGSGRPFQLEHIALKASGLTVAFNGPYVNNLPSRLLCLAQRPRFAARPVTRLFRELPLCGGERRLSLSNQAFWNRPRCKILATPEMTAGMTSRTSMPLPTCRYSKRPALGLLDVARFVRTLSRTARGLPSALKVAKKFATAKRCSMRVFY